MGRELRRRDDGHEWSRYSHRRHVRPRHEGRHRECSRTSSEADQDYEQFSGGAEEDCHILPEQRSGCDITPCSRPARTRPSKAMPSLPQTIQQDDMRGHCSGAEAQRTWNGRYSDYVNW